MIVFIPTCLYLYIASTPNCMTFCLWSKTKKITNLTNRQSRVTPAQQTVEAVVTNNAPNTSKLVVTILEDLPLGDDERALLAKGPNFIPITTLTDEFTVKEDSEKFLRRLRQSCLQLSTQYRKERQHYIHLHIWREFISWPWHQYGSHFQVNGHLYLKNSQL